MSAPNLITNPGSIIERSRADKPALEKFLERLYKVKVYKFGNLEDRFIIIPEPMEISEVVELSKRWCNKNGFRFMGVRPLFEMVKDD